MAVNNDSGVDVFMRILLRDGTPEGTVLAQLGNVSAAAIPPEYAQVRVQDREGKYQVIEGGNMYYFTSQQVMITVVVDQVPNTPVDWTGDEE